MPRKKEPLGEDSQQDAEQLVTADKSFQEGDAPEGNSPVQGFPMPNGWDIDMLRDFAEVDDAMRRDAFLVQLKESGLPEMSVNKFFEQKDRLLEQCAKSVAEEYAEGEKRLASLEEKIEELQSTSKAFAELRTAVRSIYQVQGSLNFADGNLQKAQKTFALEKARLAQVENETSERKRSMEQPGALSRFFNTNASKQYAHKQAQEDALLESQKKALEKAEKTLKELQTAIEGYTKDLASVQAEKKEIEDGLEYKTDHLKLEELKERVGNDPYAEKALWLERTYVHNRTYNGELPKYLADLNRAEMIKDILEELGHSIE